MDWKNKPKSFWRERLTDLQYKVTQEHATERAFTGEYNNHKAEGEYVCVCCGTVLFDSQTKFDSGCGWPSFYDAVGGKSTDLIEFKADTSHGMDRIEILCKTCGAHLGHVFDDGPQPTGKRYCNNGVALWFVPQGDTLPELRR